MELEEMIMHFIDNNGTMQFEDVYDLVYNLLNAIGLSINAGGYIYDQDTSIEIQIHGCKLKASVDPRKPCYAGQGEVVFDIMNNIRLVTTMLGYCIDKESVMNGFNSVSHYPEEIPESRLTAMTIKMADQSTRTTLYYKNKCLKFVHAMFLVYDEKVDLRNFDTEG
jgi:hypothetical protein